MEFSEFFVPKIFDGLAIFEGGLKLDAFLVVETDDILTETYFARVMHKNNSIHERNMHITKSETHEFHIHKRTFCPIK